MSRIDEANESNHLNEIEDGAGCVEIWERLSEARGEGKAEVEGEGKAEAEADDD